jgi:hypothetical protein
LVQQTGQLAVAPWADQGAGGPGNVLDTPRIMDTPKLASWRWAGVWTHLDLEKARRPFQGLDPPKL